MKNKVRTLNVWDIDDTLFKTDARVTITKDGKPIKVLNPGEFNTYNLKQGEKFDFTQFRSGKIFRETAKPINNVLDKAKEIVSKQNEDSKSIILTARSDFNDHKEFVQTFRDHGFPIDQVYIERAGNLARYNPAVKPHITKGVILRKYINTGNYDRIRMWDDSESNLKMLMKLGKLHPEIEMIGYLVDDDGSVKRYASSLKEDFEVPHSGMTFGRNLMPQISTEQMKSFLSYLDDNDVEHRDVKVVANALKPTQSEFNFDQVEVLMHSPRKKDKKIIVSKDLYVMDGHHRWLADYNKDKGMNIDVHMVDLPILELLRLAKQFGGVTYKPVTETVSKVVKESLINSRYGKL